MTAIRTEEIGWWCEECQFKTAGIIQDEKTVCPRCKTELKQDKLEDKPEKDKNNST